MKIKFYTKTILALFFYFGLQSTVNAQIDICVSVSKDSLVFAYKAKKNYDVAPINFWNSQLITVRYPNNIAVKWGGITQYSNFQWEEDPTTPNAGSDGGDGFFYKTFYSANTPTQALKNNAFKQVFKVQFVVNQKVTFEPITNTAITKQLHLDAAINNAVEPGSLNDGNIFNAFIKGCGTLTYDFVPIDLDGDGFTGIDDPDDNNPCVPKSVALANVLATDMSDCATQNGKITIAATGNDSLFYSINNGISFVKTNVFSGLGKGVYQIIVKNKFGCIKKFANVTKIDCDSSICFNKIPPTFVLNTPVLKNKKSGDTITMECGFVTTLQPNVDIKAINISGKSVIVKAKQEKSVVFPTCKNGYKMLKEWAWTATDTCGNKAEYVVFVKIKDTTPPVLNGVPPNTVIVSVANLPFPAAVTANDQCDQNVSVIYNEVKSGDTLITRTWLATDLCGNFVKGSQLIFIKKRATYSNRIFLEMYENETEIIDITSKQLPGQIEKMDVLYQDIKSEVVKFQTQNFNNKNVEIIAKVVGIEEITYGRYDKANNCDTLLVQVLVKKRQLAVIDPSDDDIFVYTGFSPNEDGLNDAFTIRNIEKYPNTKVTIYNRWGNQVFKTQDYKNDWEGIWNNRPLPNGTYYYLINIPGRERLAGYVQLER